MNIKQLLPGNEKMETLHFVFDDFVFVSFCPVTTMFDRTGCTSCNIEVKAKLGYVWTWRSL